MGTVLPASDTTIGSPHAIKRRELVVSSSWASPGSTLDARRLGCGRRWRSGARPSLHEVLPDHDEHLVLGALTADDRAGVADAVVLAGYRIAVSVGSARGGRVHPP